MDEYCLSSEGVETESSALPFSREEVPCADKVLLMKVRAGTNINNITRYALNHIKDESARQVVFCGSGAACSKVISSVEVLKRQMCQSEGALQSMCLCQVTRSRYTRLQDTWTPNQSEHLQPLVVNRDVPCIYILLSKDPIANSSPGHQETERSVPRLVTHSIEAKVTGPPKHVNLGDQEAELPWKRKEKIKDKPTKPYSKPKSGKTKPTTATTSHNADNEQLEK